VSEETTTATAPTSVAPAPVAATTVAAPEPAKPVEPSDSVPMAAYKGAQRVIDRVQRRNDDLLAQNTTLANTVGSLKEDLDILLKQNLGDEGYQARVKERALSQERQAALAAANTAEQFIPAAIDVMASTMRAAGVSETDIKQVFASARETSSVAEWSEATKQGMTAAITKVKATVTQQVEQQVRAKSADEVKAEATALAEHALRAKGMDKVDLGQGTGANRDLASRIKTLDRSTEDGEAQYQRILKDAKAGRLGRY
jgi:hypothetical protein